MRSNLFMGVAAVLVAGVATAAGAAGFPAGNPITIMVPYAPGGTVDSAARLMAAGLEKEMKTPVQVVNKAGAASQVALTALVNAKPDGYTLSYAVLPTVITHYLDPDRKAPYTPKSFQPIGLHFVVPAMLAVRTESPHKTLRDLVAAAKAAPERSPSATAG